MKATLPYILLFLFSCSLSQVHAQRESKFELQQTIGDSIQSFSVDLLGAVYLIKQNHQLVKYDADGNVVGRYNHLSNYGKLTYAEAQNPWKVLLYYKDFSTIVMLDKYLDELGSVNLRSKNIYGVSAITTSYDNNIWLYETQSAKIKKIDNDGNLLMQSSDLRLMLDESPQPVQIVDSEGKLYLNDPERGIYVFDYYGGFKKRIPMDSSHRIAVIGNTIYGFRDSTLVKYSPPLPLIKTFPLPDAIANSKKIVLAGGKIYVLKDGQLEVYILNHSSSGRQ